MIFFASGLRDLQQELSVLEANHEVEILKQRDNDAPFLTELRSLQEKRDRLKSIQFDEQRIHSVFFDYMAYPPQQHIKPKRKLIVVMGVILDIMLGVFLVFFVAFRRICEIRLRGAKRISCVFPEIE